MRASASASYLQSHIGNRRMEKKSNLGRGLHLRAACSAILTLSIVIGITVHQKTLARQTPKAQDSRITVRYTDVRPSAGITFRQDATQTEEKYYLETMGTGVGWIDYDQDGLMDLYFVQSAATDIYKPAHPLRSALYYNNGDGTFTVVTEKAGVGGEGHYGQGVAVGDFDNDGYPDLYVTGYGRAILYHNNGNGTFTDVTEKAGVADQGGWATSAGWFDYDKDGYLDLVVANYIDWSPKNNIWCGEHRPGYRAYCHPDNYDGVTNILYHNNGEGTFTDVSAKAGVANPAGKWLGVAFADYDGDGFEDIFVANDSVQCFLYHNNGNGTFSEVGLLAGVGYNEDGKTFAGMGVDFSDYDNDGLPDIVVTDLSNERYMLFRNNGDGTFRDVTNQSGLGGATLTFSGWSSRCFDNDTDGWN